MAGFLKSTGGDSNPTLTSGSHLDFEPSERERLFREWLLRDVLGSPGYAGLVSWLKTKLVVDGFELPIGQVIGFSGFTFQTSEILTAESTTSATYVDLTTAGPTLTGLPDGNYAIFYGVTVDVDAAGSPIASLSINGAAAAEDDSIVASCTASGLFYSISRMATRELSGGGNNSVQMKYRSGGGVTSTFRRRWVSAVKYANL